MIFRGIEKETGREGSRTLYIEWFALPHAGWLPGRPEHPCQAPFPSRHVGTVRGAPLQGFGAMRPVVSVLRAAPPPFLNPLHTHSPEEQRDM